MSLAGSAGLASMLEQETAKTRPEQNLPTLSPQRAWLSLLGQGVGQERDYSPRVEGVLPAGLRGTLYRNGPGLFERDGFKKSTLLDGDGLIRSLTITDQTARFRCRFVQTPKFKEESAAGRFLHPTWTTLAPKSFEDLPAIPILSQAGVLPMVKNGRLLVFDEVGLPFELDPRSLETIAQVSPFDLPATHAAINFKAHTKIDGLTGAWVLAGGRAGRNPDLQVLLQDSRGRRIAHVSMPCPRARYTYYHDFFWAGRYVVFHLHPAFLSPLLMLLGKRSFADCISWHAAEGSMWVVVDPRAEHAPTIVELPAAWMWHSVNAFVSGDSIIADFVGYDAPDHFLGPDAVLRNVMRGREGSSIHAGALRRCTLDLKSKRGTLQTLTAGHFEFPVVHPARVGRRHRYIYLASGDLRDGWFHNGVARVDVETGLRREYRFGQNCCASEPVYVPDPSISVSSSDAESSGWLMCEVIDGESRKSFIAVFNVASVDDGPIAKVYLKHHMPLSFHGCWEPAA